MDIEVILYKFDAKLRRTHNEVTQISVFSQAFYLYFKLHIVLRQIKWKR